MNKTFLTALVVAALAGAALPQAGWTQIVRATHQTHTATFDEPVVLVNGVTLPAGTYVFMFPTPEQSGVTRILSQDGKKLFATLTTISTQRKTSSGFDVILVTEPASKGPRTLKSWYCDASQTGHEFVAHKEH